MDFLISLYDNSLLIYPNIFFVALFFVGILGIILISVGTFFLWKQIKKVIKEIKSNLKQIRRIKKEEGSKTPFLQMIRVLVRRKSLSSLYIVKVLIVFIPRIIGIFFILMNEIIEQIGLRTEKIIRKIGKEIFINE